MTLWKKEQKETKRFILGRDGRGEWQLEFCPAEDSLFPREWRETQFAVAAVVHPQKEPTCFFTTVCSLVRKEEAAIHHVHTDTCGKLASFLSASAEMRKLLGGRSVIVVSHVSAHPTRKGLFSPKNQVWAVLAFFRPDSDILLSTSSAVCVALGINGALPYQLLPQYASTVKQLVRGRQRQIPREDLPGEDVARASKAPPSPPPATTPIKSGCCSACDNEPLYRGNMNRDGPQYVLQQQESIFSLLHCLGWKTHANVENVLRGCRLTNCFFDIEATTVDCNAEVGNEDAELPFTVLSDVKKPRKWLAHQEPVLIGVCDGWGMEQGKEVEILRLQRGQTTAELIGQFVDRVFEMREEATVVKYEIFSDLFERLERYKKAYLDFFEERLQQEPHLSQEEMDDQVDFYCTEEAGGGDDVWFPEDEESSNSSSNTPRKRRATTVGRPATTPEARWEKVLRKRRQRVAAAFKATIWGQLLDRLTWLCNSFMVWSYHGSHYDIPMITASLCVHIKERRKCAIRINRIGSSVRFLKTCNIWFLDALLLLSPNYSLSKFGQMVGIEEAKQIFNFDWLTSLDALDIPSLPPLAISWKNRLTQSGPTQQQVDSAIQLFEEMNFSNLGDWLTHYLRLDCILLAKSMMKLLEEYHTLLDLHVCDSRKTTISSLSAAGAQHYLMKAKRVGVFTANNTQIYAVIMHKCCPHCLPPNTKLFPHRCKNWR